MNTTRPGPFLTDHPELGTATIPVEPYTSADYYAREIEQIFRRDWLFVAREEELPKPGDFKVKRLDFAHTSVILIRGKDGQVRAFHNVCRHRSNKIIPTPGEETVGSRRGAVMQCRYHGWVYDAQGALVDVPCEGKFPPGFKRSENGLVPIHVDTWDGFICINLAERPRQSLVEALGNVVQHLQGYPFGTMTQCYTYHAHIDCNWKVGMDAFGEAYHVPTIHAGTFPGFANYWLDDVRFYGEHRSVAIYSNEANPPTPVGTAANAIFAASIVLQRAAPFALPAEVNPQRSRSWGFEGIVIFPNFMIHVGEGLWFTHQFWPVTENRCLWQARYYLPPPATNSARWAQRYAVTLQRNGWLEDTATMEDTHEALRSGVVKELNLQDEEILLRHHFHVVNHRVRGQEGT